VLALSKMLNMPVYKIISSLVNNKIIEKRQYVRGYKEYTETDEYKNKVGTNKKSVVDDTYDDLIKCI
jgi:hypothetical protein